MAREIHKAVAKGINAGGNIVEAFADAYIVNTQIEVVENLSDSNIKGTESMTLEQKAQVVNSIYNLMRKK